MKNLVLFLSLTLATPIVFADEVDNEATAMEATKNNPQWTSTLKEKYNLTDDQIKSLTESGVSHPQMAMAAELAKQSNKSIDEVLKMRTEQKMGWGAIAKELGVKPGSLGHSVSEMRHQINENKHGERMERHKEHQRERREKRESHKNKGK